jgi:hypothetical protein
MAHAGKAVKRKRSNGSSDESESDWVPESEDEAAEVADATDTVSELSLVDSDRTRDASAEAEGDGNEDEDVLMVDEEATTSRGAVGKRMGKGSPEEEAEAALDAEVAAAAQRMIEAAKHERSMQEQGKSLLHEV